MKKNIRNEIIMPADSLDLLDSNLYHEHVLYVKLFISI